VPIVVSAVWGPVQNHCLDPRGIAVQLRVEYAVRTAFAIGLRGRRGAASFIAQRNARHRIARFKTQSFQVTERQALLFLSFQLMIILANKPLNVTRHADELRPLLFVKRHWEAPQIY